MLKIDLQSIKPIISGYVKEYYGLQTKPDMIDFDSAKNRAIVDLFQPLVDSAVIRHELSEFVPVEPKGVDRLGCLETRKLKIAKPLERTFGGDASKFLLQGKKTVAKIERVRLENELDGVKKKIHLEFDISRKAAKLGVGPAVLDAFICFTSNGECFKVVVSDYIPGISLANWLKKKQSKELRAIVSSMVEKKLDKMHANGIIHNGLYEDNVILMMNKKTPVDVFFTDFERSFDKNTNKFTQWDSDVLQRIQTGTNTRHDHTSDRLNYYIITRMIENGQLEIIS